MGLSKMSSSSFDAKPGMYRQAQENSSNPDPSNYKILVYAEIKGNLILEIQYYGCSNYEGKKILVFKKCTYAQLIKQKKIDPHFSDNKKLHSPIARFEPTKEGWILAKTIVNLL